MSTLRIEIPPKLITLFAPPRGALRYRVMHGGRGSGKSFTAAKMAAIWGAIEPLRILCVRELQNSIKESFHAELKNAIQSCTWLSGEYDVGIDYLRHKTNGTEFIFKGLRHNITAVKSMAQIDLCIVEEAEDIPHASWTDLLPTIRIAKSEVWVIYNPKRRKSYVAEAFQLSKPPPRSAVVELNWRDNPWFSDVLEEQRADAQDRFDPALYRHIWEGEFYESSEAQVFNGKYHVEEFTPDTRHWDSPLFGLDFGFSQDETAGVKCWINDYVLYIEHELYERHLEIDDTAAKMIELLPDVVNHSVRADNARPESISYLKRHGIHGIESCVKGAGSVEDGIMFIKSFKKIIIHPRCVNTINEFNMYSFKIDRHTGEITDSIIDSYNHAIDALRYALEPVMKAVKHDYGSLL